MIEPEFNIVTAVRSIVSVCIRGGLTLTDLDKLVMREYLTQALESSGNNQCELAIKEGVHRNTLSRMLKKYDVQSPYRGWRKARK